MKLLAFFFLTFVFLSSLMLVRGTEPQPSGPELFTLTRNFWSEVRFAVVSRPEPAIVTGSAIAKRQHFGYPCYALIVDESRVGNFYAKLDLVRFAANTLVAACITSAFLAVFSIAASLGIKNKAA